MLKTYVALSGALETLKDEMDGASLVEYGLLVALVAIAVIVTLNSLSLDIGNAFNTVGDKIRAAANSAGTGGGSGSGSGGDDGVCPTFPC